MNAIPQRLNDPWEPLQLATKLDRAFDNYEPETTWYAKLIDDLIPTATFVRACDLVFPEQEWVVKDFVGAGSLIEVVGKVKKGKSTLVYQLVDCCIRGEEFLGRAVVKTPVVLLTEQMNQSLKATLGRAGLLECPDLHVLTKAGLRAAGGWEKGVRAAVLYCEEIGSRLLVIDTLSRLAGLAGDAENKSGSVMILDVLSEAQDKGIACVCVRHARKGTPGADDDSADYARGSSAITGEMDIVIRLKPCDELRVLSWESRLDDDPEDIYLQYENGRYSVVDKPVSAQARKADETFEKIRAALLRLGEDASDREVALECGLSHPTVGKYRKRMNEAKPEPEVTA